MNCGGATKDGCTSSEELVGVPWDSSGSKTSLSGDRGLSFSALFAVRSYSLHLKFLSAYYHAAGVGCVTCVLFL